jgi:hypothetical protein
MRYRHYLFHAGISTQWLYLFFNIFYLMVVGAQNHNALAMIAKSQISGY